MQSLHLVFRYVIRQPRRAILTMLTFAVATFIFTVLAAIPGSIDMILKKTSETLRLYSYNADGRYLGVPARDCRTIESIPGVVACMPMVVLRATYQNASEVVQAFALDADKVALMYPDYNLPPQVLEQFSNNRDAAVAGRLLMRKHGWKVGDVVTLRGDSNRLDIKFQLVGEIPADNYPNFFMFRRDYLVEAEKAIGIPEEKHPAGFLVTRVDAASHIPSVIHRNRQRLSQLGLRNGDHDRERGGLRPDVHGRRHPRHRFCGVRGDCADDFSDRRQFDVDDGARAIA